MGKYQLNGREKRARSSGTYPRLSGGFLLLVLNTPSVCFAFSVLSGSKFPAAQRKEKQLQGALEEPIVLPALRLRLSARSSQACDTKAQCGREPLSSGQAAPRHRSPAGIPQHRAAHFFCIQETAKSLADILGITVSDAEGFICIQLQPPKLLSSLRCRGPWHLCLVLSVPPAVKGQESE